MIILCTAWSISSVVTPGATILPAMSSTWWQHNTRQGAAADMRALMQIKIILQHPLLASATPCGPGLVCCPTQHHKQQQTHPRRQLARCPHLLNPRRIVDLQQTASAGGERPLTPPPTHAHKRGGANFSLAVREGGAAAVLAHTKMMGVTRRPSPSLPTGDVTWGLGSQSGIEPVSAYGGRGMCAGTSSLGDTLPGRSGGGFSTSSLRWGGAAFGCRRRRRRRRRRGLKCYCWAAMPHYTSEPLPASKGGRAYFLERLSSSDRPLRAWLTIARAPGLLLRDRRPLLNSWATRWGPTAAVARATSGAAALSRRQVAGSIFEV